MPTATLARTSPYGGCFHIGARRSVLLTGDCDKVGFWDRAMELTAEMASGSVEQNTISYSAAISACEKGGEWPRDVDLLIKMAGVFVDRNTITFNAAYSACVKAQVLYWAMQPMAGKARYPC